MNLLFIDDYYRSFLGSEFTFTRYGFTFTKKIMTDLVSITIAIAAFMFLNQIYFTLSQIKGMLLLNKKETSLLKLILNLKLNWTKFCFY